MNLAELTRELDTKAKETLERVSLDDVAGEIKSLLLPVPSEGRFEYQIGSYIVTVSGSGVHISNRDIGIRHSITGKEAEKFYADLNKRYETQPMLYETERRVQTSTDSMRWMGIVRADLGKQVYEGYITCSDDIEMCIFGDAWIAEPSTEDVIDVNGKRYGFKIKYIKRPFESNENFTYNGDMNRRIREYIMQSILEFNPKISHLDKSTKTQ